MLGVLLLALWMGPDDGVHRATLFLDFDGGLLTQGENAALGEAACVSGEPLSYPPFRSTSEQATAVAEAVQTLLSAYGVRVAWGERPPAHLPYTVVMVGGDPEDFGLDPSRGGVACRIDCDDMFARDTAFVFDWSAPLDDAGWLARTAVHEAAHTWGLEHVQGQENLMYEFATGEEQTWASSCMDLMADEGGCAEVHQRFCPPGQQNSDAELLAMFGPNTPDTTAPTVTILSPEDGAHALPGTEITVEAEITDDFAGFGWRFAVPELGWEHVAYDNETSLVLPFPEGDFTIVVEAIDHDRNVGKDHVSVRVDWDADATGTETTTGTGTSDDPALEGPVASCACGAGGGAQPWPWSVWLVVCVGLRRRATPNAHLGAAPASDLEL